MRIDLDEWNRSLISSKNGTLLKSAELIGKKFRIFEENSRLFIISINLLINQPKFYLEE